MDSPATEQTMDVVSKKSHTIRRRFVKKEKRRRKRKTAAQLRDTEQLKR